MYLVWICVLYPVPQVVLTIPSRFAVIVKAKLEATNANDTNANRNVTSMNKTMGFLAIPRDCCNFGC